MTQDELDRILSSEDTIVPSSGFTDGVLAAVRTPTRSVERRFPWLRFGAGVAASGLMACAGVTLLDRATPAIAARLPSHMAIGAEWSLAAAATAFSLGVAVATRFLTRR